MLEEDTMKMLKRILAVGEREGVFQTKEGRPCIQAETRVRSSTHGIQYLSSLRACSPDQSTTPLENQRKMQALAAFTSA